MKDASVYPGGSASRWPAHSSPWSTTARWLGVGQLRHRRRGQAAQRNVLIEKGILTDYMWDYLRARKEGRLSSGNGRRQSYQHLPMVRMTNTFLLPARGSRRDRRPDASNGVYVAKLGGGQVNTATGDFVFGTTEAYLIEDGRSPIRCGTPT